MKNVDIFRQLTEQYELLNEENHLSKIKWRFIKLQEKQYNITVYKLVFSLSNYNGVGNKWVNDDHFFELLHLMDEDNTLISYLYTVHNSDCKWELLNKSKDVRERFNTLCDILVYYKNMVDMFKGHKPDSDDIIEV